MTARAALLLAVLAAQAQDPSPLRFERVITLPGVDGRIDHLSVDLVNQRLFVAALGNHSVEVIDLAAGKVLPGIRGLGAPQGVLYVPTRNQLYVNDGTDGACHIYDAAGFRPFGMVKFGRDADNLRLDAARNQVWAGYGKGGLGILDTATGARVASVKLPGHPEAFQLEQTGNRAFVNVPDSAKIFVIDRDRRTIATDWPVPAGAANFPMALDEAGQRLFIGCRKPAQLLVVRTTDGARAASTEICGDTDDLFFDAQRKRLYVSCGEGFVDVIDAESYKRLERIRTVPGARTSLFVPALNRLFVAVPRTSGHDAEIRVYRVANGTP